MDFDEERDFADADNMPYRTGGAESWNFEKAYSILHKVRPGARHSALWLV